MKRIPVSLSLGTLLMAALAAAPVHADDDDEDTIATYAVQKRQFRLGGELTGSLGFLPLNAFNKAFTAGGAFTYHPNNVWAWEIVQVAYAVKQFDTGLKKELLENFDVEPTQIPQTDLLISSNLVLKPFYGKLALFNRSITHVELYVPIGGGAAKRSNPSSILPTANAGLGIRFFLAQSLSLRVEVRDYLIFRNLDITNELFVGASLAMSLGGAER